MIKDVKQFMEVSKTLPKRGEFDQKLTGLYISLILEEVSELMETQGCEYERALLHEMSKVWRRGDFAADKNVETLDAMMDIAYVAFGAAYAMGADTEGAAKAVHDNNMLKFPIVNGEYTVLRDENGKIKKPEGFKSVELDKYL